MIVFIILVTFGTVSTFGNVLTPEDQSVENFIESNVQFTTDLYKEVSRLSYGKSFLFSPFSVEEILASVWSGSKGKTAIEIQKTLHLPDKYEDIETALQSILPKLKSNNNFYNLTLANRIYVKDGFVINPVYKKKAKKIYSVDVENINFNEAETASALINKWIEKQTNYKIHNLLSADELTDLTQILLINTLNFGGKWEKNFNNPLTTTKRIFYNSDLEKVEVDTMSVRDTFRYYECSAAKVLEFPYEGEEISMVIILPKTTDGWKNLSNFSDDLFKYPNYTLEYVHVELPRFHISYTIDFKHILQKLGIVTAFNKADFGRIINTTTEDVAISSVLQKTYINVTEDGTEAAVASSGLVASLASVTEEEPSRYFIADHPFLFYIRSPFGILFVGQYTG